MYHEATVCNLLEILLYHKTACENSENSLVELIDYCYRKFLFLHKFSESGEGEKLKPKTGKDYIDVKPEEELERQHKEIEF